MAVTRTRQTDRKERRAGFQAHTAALHNDLYEPTKQSLKSLLHQAVLNTGAGECKEPSSALKKSSKD